MPLPLFGFTPAPTLYKKDIEQRTSNESTHVITRSASHRTKTDARANQNKSVRGIVPCDDHAPTQMYVV